MSGRAVLRETTSGDARATGGVEQVGARRARSSTKTSSPSRTSGRRSVLSFSGCAAGREADDARCRRGPRRARRAPARPPSAMRRSPGRTPSTTSRAVAVSNATGSVDPATLTACPSHSPASRFIGGVPRNAGDGDRRRPGEDFARRADLDDAAVHEDGDAVGERHRLFLVVRDVDRGDAERALQRAAARGASRGAAWRRGWRAARRAGTGAAGARSRAPARSAAAGRRRAGRACAAAGGRCRPCAAASATARSISAARDADHLQREADVLRRPSCADRARSSGTPSRRRARPAPGRDVDAVHQHAAGVHRLEAGEDAQRRRLARARGPEQDEEFARLDREVDAVQHRRRAVLLDDAFDARRVPRAACVIAALRP